jgi:RHS repeat-associated protein
MEAWGYNCDAETLSETRVWGSEPENVHCSSATTPLRIELRWGCEESSEKTAVGSGVTFKYDPLGRRIEKISPSAASIFAYDGDNLIEETNSSGGVVARYEDTQNIDEPLAMLRSSATSYYNADGLGSVTSLTNSSGAAAETYTYDSFGKVMASSGTLVNPFQYTGREMDPETGLYYYRARYYDPAAGRFIGEDPLGIEGGINSYRYVSNGPANSTDPLGLCPPDPKKKCDAIFPSDPTTAKLAQLVYGEGNGSPSGDLAVASVVVNDANYGNPSEFGMGIIGVIYKKFVAPGGKKFNRVSTADKVGTLDPADCQSYKNATLAAIGAQQPNGTNTDALFYFDTSIGAPQWMRNGIAGGYIVPTAVPGGIGVGNNYLRVPQGGSGNDQVFFTYTDYSH